MPMERKRFDELKLDGVGIECPHCKLVSPLKFGNTTGGGYGAIGIICDVCQKRFSIDGGA